MSCFTCDILLLLINLNSIFYMHYAHKSSHLILFSPFIKYIGQYLKHVSLVQIIHFINACQYIVTAWHIVY
ncbi:UNVERIFIED_CONTAM: hypothetical protein NCL1_39555 [Trichonephila clavipes]